MGSVYGDEGATEREAAGVTPAAVLVAVIDHPGEPTVLFTRRTPPPKAPPARVGLRGAPPERGDPGVESPARRETREETGLPPGRGKVIAPLPEYFPRPGFRVT